MFYEIFKKNNVGLWLDQIIIKLGQKLKKNSLKKLNTTKNKGFGGENHPLLDFFIKIRVKYRFIKSLIKKI